MKFMLGLAGISILVMALLLLLPSSNHAAERGDIQITSEPGVRIWLNEDFKGKTRANENGMFIEGLPPGRYTIKAAKSGFQMETRSVAVQSGKTIEVRLTFTTPSIQVEDIGRDRQVIRPPATGTMILRSVPLHAQIYLDGKAIGKADTRVSNLPAGRHHLRFTFKGQTLEDEFVLSPNQTLKLKAHFKKNTIINEFDREFTNQLGMKFVYIPPGSVTLQNDPDMAIPLDGFFIQTTEVTLGQWKQVMEGDPAFAERWNAVKEIRMADLLKCGDSCPVSNVSWGDVQKFIHLLNQREGSGRYRLPKQSEWEYACRCGRNEPLCYGGTRSLDDIAWYEGNSGKKPHPVSRKAPNELGLYDMLGNVSEVCDDLYDGMDPIRRGGNYSDPSRMLSCSVQEVALSSSSSPTAGFRLIREP